MHKKHCTWHEQICNRFTTYGYIHYLILSKDSRRERQKPPWNGCEQEFRTANRIEHTHTQAIPVWHTSTAGLYYSTQKHTLKRSVFQIVYHIDIVAGIELSSKLIRLWNEVHFRSTTKTSLAQQNNAISLSDTKAKHFPRPHTHNFHSLNRRRTLCADGKIPTSDRLLVRISQNWMNSTFIT